MAQRDSAPQESMVGATLVLHGGINPLNNKGLSVGGSVVPSRGVPAGISGHGVWHSVFYPPW